MVKTQNMPAANELRSDKSAFQTKKKSIQIDKHTSVKNNNWNILGKPYCQLVFVSVGKKFTLLLCLYR